MMPWTRWYRRRGFVLSPLTRRYDEGHRDGSRVAAAAYAEGCRDAQRDERERIAQAIEAHTVPESYDVGYRDGYIDAHVVAARIARNGGRDE